MEQVEREILVPVIHALKRARRPFRGVLYAGLMLTNQGPKVLEFNVRFGDPETQVVLMRLKSDLLDVLEAAADERLDSVSLEWDPRPAVTVVMAAEGYPGHYERDRPIQNLDAVERMPDVKVFHAGTTLRAEAGPGPRRPDRHRRRPRAQRHGPRRLDRRCPGPRLRGRRDHQVPRRLVPPRHRRANPAHRAVSRSLRGSGTPTNRPSRTPDPSRQRHFFAFSCAASTATLARWRLLGK